MTLKEESTNLTPRQREGRAINAVAELLRRTLSVPNIYFEPPASLTPADVLAVDRGGAGDLHAVEIKLLDMRPAPLGPAPKRTPAKDAWITAAAERRHREVAKGAHRQLMSMPAHFRYLAIPAESFEVLLRELSQFGLYAEDGIGRLGIITITEKGTDSPLAEVVVAPERFRVDPAKLKNIEAKFLSKSRPDIEVRI
jgi:hypothetical protein